MNSQERTQLIREKINAGLSREDAAEVVDSQAKLDAPAHRRAMRKLKAGPLPPTANLALVELTHARKGIAESLAALVKADGGLGKMREDEEKLNADIVRIEAGLEYTDEGGVAKVETKRSQLAILRGSIQEIEEELSPQNEHLRAELNELRTLIPAVVNGTYRALLIEIARQLLPVWGTWDTALWAARNSPKLASFAHFYLMRHFGGWSDGAAEAKNVLPILDALIAGEQPWTFVVEAAPKTVGKFSWE